MTIELKEIPGLSLEPSALWKVRALVIDGLSPSLAALEEWSRKNQEDYKRIKTAIRVATQFHRCTSRKHVGKNQNPDHGDVYEFISYTGKARLMFFYDDSAESLIICTNAIDKGGKSQDAAFRLCAEYKTLYKKHK